MITVGFFTETMSPSKDSTIGLPGADAANGGNLQLKKHPSMSDSRFFQAMWSCANGDLNGLRGVVEGGLDVNSVDYDSRSLLHVAAAEGQLEIAKYLIEKGVEIEMRDRSGGVRARFFARVSAPWSARRF